MTRIEYKEKYRKLKEEYEAVPEKEWIDKFNRGEKNLNPFADLYWLDYLRDQKFSFDHLHFPKQGSSWYDDFHNRFFEVYADALTVYKEYVMERQHKSKWVIDIKLNGDYIIYDDFGVVIVDVSDSENTFVEMYSLPKNIGCVADAMRVVDFVEMHKHGKGD